ncbi:hypothetical protein [Nocardia sp. XZ_19_385]|uniref:hypothetical protein n=1 Tax=Nocardia sp. XZ_19_385 TaxID=2769488 RepID=UPI00188F8F94|nr:hypothetical protein [Nocardia sp. XZ_19_385]
MSTVWIICGAAFTYAHLLPTFWADFQDSYISLPHTNVTWFSWMSALAEIGTGLLYGFIGIRVLRDRQSRSAPNDARPQHHLLVRNDQSRVLIRRLLPDPCHVAEEARYNAGRGGCGHSHGGRQVQSAQPRLWRSSEIGTCTTH